jgi:hypothetical protein
VRGEVGSWEVRGSTCLTLIGMRYQPITIKRSRPHRIQGSTLTVTWLQFRRLCLWLILWQLRLYYRSRPCKKSQWFIHRFLSDCPGVEVYMDTSL